ncbi:MAG: bacillithiol biosynthesis BshC, partial [Terriglobia bacterium]
MAAFMDSHCISFAEIPHTTGLFRDYLHDFARVKRFFAHDPFDPGSFAAARTAQIDFALCRAVADVLAAQNDRLGAGPATLENIQRLREARVRAVVTGQQVGLFGGPAYSVYKALTAIALAERLSAQGMPAVPVFWLASEDHDFAEVNHCLLLDDQQQFVALRHLTPPRADAPVGQIEFQDAIESLREQAAALWPGEAAAEANGLLSGYRTGATYGQAFGRLLQRLLAGRGLIVLDSADATLHHLSLRVFRRALEDAPALDAKLRERDRELTKAGYHAQVRLRENATLLFH